MFVFVFVLFYAISKINITALLTCDMEATLTPLNVRYMIRNHGLTTDALKECVFDSGNICKVDSKPIEICDLITVTKELLEVAV